jgi:transcriptional regulator with XRE-family HTH domain
LQPLDAERVKEWRHRRMLSQQEVADRAGTSLFTIQRIERGEGNVRPKTGRGVAAALGIPIEELLPKAQAPLFREPPEQESAEERRAVWETAAVEARRLREAGWAQMWRALSEWRASKQRGEPYAARRKFLDEMGNLLREVYAADVALGHAYIEAAWTTQGGSEASVPSYLQEESRTTTRFYGELLGLVKSARLSVLTGDDAAAAKRATSEQAAAGHVQPETRSLRVEEPDEAA